MPEVHIILNQPERPWNAPTSVKVFMEKTPPRIEFLGAVYSQLTDPETGEFLGAYSPEKP